jgi:hypothetical protein
MPTLYYQLLDILVFEYYLSMFENVNFDFKIEKNGTFVNTEGRV